MIKIYLVFLSILTLNVMAEDQPKMFKTISASEFRTHPEDAQYVFDIKKESCISTGNYIDGIFKKTEFNIGGNVVQYSQLKPINLNQEENVRILLKNIPNDATINWKKNFGAEIKLNNTALYVFPTERMCLSFEKVIKEAVKKENI